MVLLNAVLDRVLLAPLGAAGIALSTSLVSMFNTAAPAWPLRRHIGGDEVGVIVVAIGLLLAVRLSPRSWAWRRIFCALSTACPAGS